MPVASPCLLGVERPIGSAAPGKVRCAQAEVPVRPKSNAYLLPGQFWGVPLSDGRWGYGRVLAVKTEPDAYFPGNNRTLLAALMCWQGDEPPTAAAIAGRQVLTRGWAHVRSIQRNGQMILGCRDLGLDGIRGLREVTHRGGGTVMLYEGATPLRPQHVRRRPACRSWRPGFKVISVLAERRFVRHLPLVE